MKPDILIVRVNEGYRVLHGHLHLLNSLNLSNEVLIEVKDLGQVKVTKTREGIFVEQESGQVPVLSY
jgi:hypothetical protein